MSNDDHDDDRRPPIHWGDMGALVLAGGFSLFGLYLVLTMLFGGHPLAVLFREPPKQPQRQLTQEDWNRKKFTTQPGEIVLSTGVARPAGASFPPVKDWSSLRIRLERDVCLGTCPSYTVEIAGDGSVVYNGRACVAAQGERRARIPAEAVRGLVAKFRDLDFWQGLAEDFNQMVERLSSGKGLTIAKTEDSESVDEPVVAAR